MRLGGNVSRKRDEVVSGLTRPVERGPSATGRTGGNDRLAQFELNRLEKGFQRPVGLDLR